MGPLVGRDRELATVRSAVVSARDGKGSVLVIDAEAGAGKTSLLSAASDIAAEIGLQMHSARAEPGDAGHPLATAGDLLRSLGIRPGETETVYHVGARLLEELEAAMAKAPLIVAADDLHWADAATVALLGRVARRAPGLPLLLMVALRPLPRTPEVVELIDRLRRDGASFLRLDPLDEAAVRLLAELVLGSLPEEAVTRQLQRAGGNALLVTECLEAIRRGHAVPDVGAAEAVIDAVRVAMGPRLRILPLATRRVLETLAVLASPPDLAVVAAVLDIAAADVLEALEPARQSGLLDEQSGSRWRFRHDLVRDVVYEDMSEDYRRKLHRSVARRLVSIDGAAASEIAHHLHAGGATGREMSDWAAKAALDVREEPEAALRWARIAAEQAKPRSADQLVLRVQLAEALLGTGRVAEARDLLDQAESVVAGGEVPLDMPTATTMARLRLRALVADGRPNAAAAFARATFGAGRIEDPLARAEAAWELLGAEDVDGAMEGVESLVAEGGNLEPEVEVLCLTVLGIAAGLRGRIDTMCDRLSTAATLLEARADPHVLHRAPQPFLSQAHRYQGDLPSAIAAGRRGLAVAEELGVPWPLPHAHQALAQALAGAGFIDEATAEWEAGLSAIEEGGTPVPRAFIQLHLAHVDLHREDGRSLEGRIADLSDDARLTTSETGSLEWVLAAAAAAAGDAGGAANHAERAVELLLAGPVLHVIPPAAELSRLLAPAGRWSALRRLAAALEAFQDQPSPWLRAVLSSVAAAGGDGLQLQTAAEQFELAGRPIDLANAREELAIAALTAGDRATALPLLDAAAETYTAVRYTLDLRRLAARARALGLRRGNRAPHRTATTGWESVTAAERRVLDLLVQGRTSRQIADALYLSPRTVESHLGRLFRKLGVRSRTELVAMVVRERDIP